MKSDQAIAQLKKADWVTDEAPNSVSKQGDVTCYNMHRPLPGDTSGFQIHVQLRIDPNNEVISRRFSLRNDNAELDDILGIQGLSAAINFLRQ